MIVRGGRVPIYQQIAAELKRRIQAGEIPPGHAVPSEHQLSSEYGVSRITATKAIRVLREEGLVYTSRGAGTFVGPEDVPRVSRPHVRYQEIADEIVRRIRSGKLKPDMPMPSETSLMQEFDVAKNTARSAVRHLRDLGWVDTVPQRGSFVKAREDWPES